MDSDAVFGPEFRAVSPPAYHRDGWGGGGGLRAGTVASARCTLEARFVCVRQSETGILRME